jgi:hypothetical protein
MSSEKNVSVPAAPELLEESAIGGPDAIDRLEASVRDLREALSIVKTHRDEAMAKYWGTRTERDEAVDACTTLESHFVTLGRERDAAMAETGALRSGVTKAIGLELSGGVVYPDDRDIIAACVALRAEVELLRYQTPQDWQRLKTRAETAEEGWDVSRRLTEEIRYRATTAERERDEARAVACPDGECARCNYCTDAVAWNEELGRSNTERDALRARVQVLETALRKAQGTFALGLMPAQTHPVWACMADALAPAWCQKQGDRCCREPGHAGPCLGTDGARTPVSGTSGKPGPDAEPIGQCAATPCRGCDEARARGRWRAVGPWTCPDCRTTIYFTYVPPSAKPTCKKCGGTREVRYADICGGYIAPCPDCNGGAP